MTLAEQIKQVIAWDAKRTQGEWQLGERETLEGRGYKIALYAPCITIADLYLSTNPMWDAAPYKEGENNAEFIAQAPLMASIIRQLTDIVKQQHEALTMAEIVVFNRHEETTKRIRDAIALSAPIVKGVV